MSLELTGRAEGTRDFLARGIGDWRVLLDHRQHRPGGRRLQAL